jgi:hypothetical protein
MDYCKCRGISILNTAYKVLSSISFKRTSLHAENQKLSTWISKGQVYCRANLSIMTNNEKNCRVFRVTLHYLFVDFNSA